MLGVGTRHATYIKVNARGMELAVANALGIEASKDIAESCCRYAADIKRYEKKVK